MSRLDDLYELRAKIDDQIRREVQILEDYAKKERERADTTCERPGWAPCGTDGGYYRHVRTLSEKPCGACRAAHAQAERDRNARRRATQETAA